MRSAFKIPWRKHNPLANIVNAATNSLDSSSLDGGRTIIGRTASSSSLHTTANSNTTSSTSANTTGTLLKVDYSFIDVEYRYGFSQVIGEFSKFFAKNLFKHLDL